MKNGAIVENTEFGKFAFTALDNKIFWAEQKVWENMPTLASRGIVTYKSNDGYLSELFYSDRS